MPAGGLALWGEFHAPVDLPQLAARCQQLGLRLSDGTKYPLAGATRGGVRLGFASLTPAEWAQGVSLLKQALQQLYPDVAKEPDRADSLGSSSAVASG